MTTPDRDRQPLRLGNYIAVGLFISLAASSVMTGLMLDTDGSSSWVSTLLLLFSIAFMLCSIWAVRSVQHVGTHDADLNRAWGERMRAALQLITEGKNGASRRAGLLMLERLSEDHDATAADRAMLRDLVKSLKSDLATAEGDRS